VRNAGETQGSVILSAVFRPVQGIVGTARGWLSGAATVSMQRSFVGIPSRREASLLRMTTESP
jgi:hypothetical protein